MFNSYFSHGLLRKYILAFGHLFRDVQIQRYDNNNTRMQTLPVPLAYGPKQKFLVRITNDPNLDRKIAISLPKMGFEISDISYDATRKLNTKIKNSYAYSDKTALKTQYIPVPYNIGIFLSIFVKNADDGTQILEQILPYFKPEWSISMNLIPGMDINMDIPIVLNGVSLEDIYEGDFITRRALTYTLQFTMKGWLYGPINNTGVITRSQIDLHANTPLNTSRSTRFILVPGLLANGSPTTNSSASIGRHLIAATDDYGFASNTFYYDDGLIYDPVSGSDIIPTE